MAAAAKSAQRPVTGLAPYYRRYELPWSPSEEMEQRFRKILRNLVIVFAIVAIVIPFLPRRERVVNTESLPRAGGAAGDGAAASAPTTSAAQARAAETPREGAGDAQTGDPGGCAREGREERPACERGRSGGAARYRPGQARQEPAQDQRPGRRHSP